MPPSSKKLKGIIRNCKSISHPKFSGSSLFLEPKAGVRRLCKTPCFNTPPKQGETFTAASCQCFCSNWFTCNEFLANWLHMFSAQVLANRLCTKVWHVINWSHFLKFDLLVVDSLLNPKEPCLHMAGLAAQATSVAYSSGSCRIGLHHAFHFDVPFFVERLQSECCSWRFDYRVELWFSGRKGYDTLRCRTRPDAMSTSHAH